MCEHFVSFVLRLQVIDEGDLLGLLLLVVGFPDNPTEMKESIRLCPSQFLFETFTTRFH